MYEIWCEWDIGQAGSIFKTEEAAWEWADNTLKTYEAELGMTLEEIKEDGLVSVNFLRIEG